MLLDIIRINQDSANIGRAATLGVARSINFTIIQAVSQDIRRRAMRQAEEEARAAENNLQGRIAPGYLAHDPANPGAGIDGFNEQMKRTHADYKPGATGDTVDASGRHVVQNLHDRVDDTPGSTEPLSAADLDDANFHEQGRALPPDPLEVASRFMVLRTALAVDLEKHARVERGLSGGSFLNPFDLVPTFDKEIERQMRPRPINEDLIRAEAAARGVPFADALRITRRANEFQAAFMANNGSDILRTIESLVAVDEKGDILTIDDAEDVYLSLDALQRVRLCQAADQGLWYLRDRVLSAQMRNVPGADGDRIQVDAMRRKIRDEFDVLMHNNADYIRERIINSSSRWPALQPGEDVLDPEFFKRRIVAQQLPSPATATQLSQLASRFNAQRPQ